MKKKIVLFVVFVVAVVCMGLTIALVIYPYGKQNIKENALVKAANEVKTFMAKKTDFNQILEYLEDDAERRHFLGVTLVKLAESEDTYALDFEARYPRYKSYRDMVNELARADYSEWIAAVIGGTVETEFEANIFEYLSLLKDNRYLTVAIDRFVSTLNNAGSSGFTAQSNKDAFIIGALSLYIVQFPGNNRILRESLGQKANYFIGLSETKMAEIKGVPLNQAYIYLYLKYFGLEDLITKKMNDFIHSGERSWDIGSRYREWDRRSWNMRDVERLISYFSSTGKGMAQNFYTLFRSGFNMDDSMRIYIGLQVIKNIGFNDPDLDYWLNRISRRDSGLTITTTSYINGVPQPGQTTRPIVFSEEVSEVRKAVAGKSEVPFDQMLNDALRTSSKTGNFIPRVTAVEVVNKEVSEMTGQYTNTYISGSIAKWKKKNSDLDRWKIIEIITISVGCLIVLLRTQKRYFNENKISLVILGQILCVFVGLLLSIAISFGIASA